jgi:hypothetical protein
MLAFATFASFVTRRKIREEEGDKMNKALTAALAVALLGAPTA